MEPGAELCVVGKGWGVKTQGQTKQVEPWYGTEYSQEAIPQEWLLRWQAPNAPADLHLPHSNPFISSDFTLIDVRPHQPPLHNF